MTAPVAAQIVAGTSSAHKRLGDVAALDGVSTGFAAGRVTALIGENGAGKTTLARAVCGLLDLDRGRLRPAARLAGYVGQDPAHYLVHDTVADEVAYALANLGVDGAASATAASPRRSTGSTWPRSPTATRATSRAASASGSRSRRWS